MKVYYYLFLLKFITSINIINKVVNDGPPITVISGLDPNSKNTNVFIKNTVIKNGKKYQQIISNKDGSYNPYRPYNPYVNNNPYNNNNSYNNNNPYNNNNIEHNKLSDKNDDDDFLLKNEYLSSKPNTDTTNNNEDEDQSANTSANTSANNSTNGPLDYRLMLAYVNQIRKKANAKPLKYNPLLTKCAQRHSNDQYRHHKMSHVGSDGSSPSDRVSKIGYRWRAVAENVAWNQRTVKEVVLTWYHSPGHYKNMINKEYDEFGAGVNHLYWTQVFGRASSF